MTITDIKSPVFRILADKNVHVLEQKAMKLSKEGWYPVGGVGRNGNDWVQVVVREREET